MLLKFWKVENTIFLCGKVRFVIKITVLRKNAQSITFLKVNQSQTVCCSWQRNVHNKASLHWSPTRFNSSMLLCSLFVSYVELLQAVSQFVNRYSLIGQ